ncbi:hypothetical protein, partial [Curtobacterium sp. UCD-KPL2560]|uniref:DUF7402 domain-containing protein n=1 Tax=Curtobacterium sp. UCD-KPL2560 TaxID=1885315 RepID=UPI000AF90296
AGTWIQLDWPAGAAGAAGAAGTAGGAGAAGTAAGGTGGTAAAGVALQAVELADRPNTDDQVTAGTLTFSDGSSVAVPSLPNGGTVQRVSFTSRQVTWVRFTITAVSATTKNTGLAELRALAATTTATEPTPSTPSVNAARTAVVTASADNPADRQTAAKTADGVVSGWPADPSAEWAAPGGGVGTWVQDDWPSGVALQSVDLADRPNTDDRVTGGTLTFSDGSSVAVPALPDDGTVTSVAFAARQVTWMRFTVTGVSGTTKNTGLAELRAWTVPTGTGTGTGTGSTPPSSTPRDVTAAAAPTASSDNPADGQTVAKAVDGVVSGWPDRADAEWVAPGGGTGTWLRLDWTSPVTLRRIVLHDRPNTVDRVTGGTLTFSDGTSVAVDALPDDGAPATVEFTPRSVTWVRFTVDRVAAGTENAGLAEFRAWAAS